MNRMKTPIYCGQCGTLALASFRGTPLCPRCLLNAVERGQDAVLLNQIRPLSIGLRTIRSLAKCKGDIHGTQRTLPKRFAGTIAYKY